MKLIKNNTKAHNYIKLVFVGFILIWLFIRSPFNPLYSDLTSGESAFVVVNFFYWLIVSAFLVWIVLSINKSNFSSRSGFILITSYGLYLTFYIFYGFDVMDSGFTLSKQWSMYNGMWQENLDAIAGTNIIGGLWLLIPRRPLLLWARTGFVIVHVVITFFSYKILRLYFKPAEIFAPFFIISFFIAIWHFYMTINYDNLPYMFYVISIYFVLRGTLSGGLDKLSFTMSGFFIAVAVFCKITYAPAILLPLYLIISENSLSDRKHTLISIFYLFLGSMAGASIIVLLLMITGSHVTYLSQFSDVYAELFHQKEAGDIQSHDHSFVKLYRYYKSAALQILFSSFRYIFFLFSLDYLTKKLKDYKFLSIAVFLFLTVVLYFITIEKNNTGQFFDHSLINIVSLFLSALFLQLIFIGENCLKKYSNLIISSLGLLIFSFLGSDIALRAAFHAGSVLVFSVTTLLLMHKNKFRIIYFFIITALALNILSKKDNYYRDSDFKFFSSPFESSPLTGIMSNPQRTDVVDSLIYFLDSIHDLKGKKILFTHSNPMMYYLSGTNYFLTSPWDLTNNFEDMKISLSVNKPDFLVIPRLSHRIGNWPLGGVKDRLEDSAQKYYEFYYLLIEQNAYFELYTNSFYSVYSLPENKK